MSNMDLWNKVAKPPLSALKTIKGGRLKGMTDINPQWRYEALTEHFGQCGVGWYYTITRRWIEEGDGVERCAFAEIDFYYKVGDDWSAPVPGIGGASFVTQETNKVHTSDECYKMAVTDALSVAVKMLGFGAEIYAGRYDGSKYREKPELPKEEETSAHWETLLDKNTTVEDAEAFATVNAGKLQKLPKNEYAKFKKYYKDYISDLPSKNKSTGDDAPLFQEK